MTNTGGSGGAKIIPSARDPVIGAVMVLPDSGNVFNVGDCTLPPTEEALPTKVVPSRDGNSFGSGFRCHNCSHALPDIGFLENLLNSICQDMFDIE